MVTKLGNELIKPIDREFPIGVDYNNPDYAFREVLKQNVWKFSVAKNYNDNLKLSNLLLRKDGSLRPWNEFKKEAGFVVGASNRYLKTEYDTIVAGAQMSRLWQEIQRDKHIFPYVQLKVILDGHTSEICSPLHDLIFAVDDPVLAYYFPPNHFNCRTTAIKLRNGIPSINYNLPEIPEAFRNNVGATGEIFTDKNAYIENTPEEVSVDFEKFQRREKDKELKEWAKLNIPDGGLQQNNFIVSRKTAKDIYSHFTNLDLKEIVKDIPTILDNLEFLNEAPLNPDSKNYEKKIASGIINFKYYTFEWRGLKFRMNVAVYKNNVEKPYAVNMITKKEN